AFFAKRFDRRKARELAGDSWLIAGPVRRFYEISSAGVGVAHASRVLVLASRQNNLVKGSVTRPRKAIQRKSGIASRSRQHARSEPDWRCVRYPDQISPCQSPIHR